MTIAPEENVVRVRRLPKQREFFRDRGRWAAARGGVGSGKTTAMLWLILERMQTYPEANHFAVGASYMQLAQGFFESLEAFCTNTLGWERDVDYRLRLNPSPMFTLLPSGARLRSLSSEQSERIASLQIQTFICEEPQTWHDGERFFDRINERLRHNETSATLYPDMPMMGRLTFNPPAKGHWLFDVIENQWPKMGWNCYVFSLRDNVLQRDLANYIANIENRISPDRWANRINGEWATTGGSAYRMFDEDVHGTLPEGITLEPDLSQPLKIGVDFNVHYMSMVIAQLYKQPMMASVDGARPRLQGWQNLILRVLDEIQLDGGSPDLMAQFIEQWGEIARITGVDVYGDATGGAKSQTASSQSAIKSNHDAIREALNAANIRYSWHIPSANPSVGDRVNATNNRLRTGSGPGLVLNSKRVPKLVRDLQLVEQGPNGELIKSKDLSLTHISDGLGYLIFQIDKVGAFEPFYA
jgi:hypothetical protein